MQNNSCGLGTVGMSLRARHHGRCTLATAPPWVWHHGHSAMGDAPRTARQAQLHGHGTAGTAPVAYGTMSTAPRAQMGTITWARHHGRCTMGTAPRARYGRSSTNTGTWHKHNTTCTAHFHSTAGTHSAMGHGSTSMEAPRTAPAAHGTMRTQRRGQGTRGAAYGHGAARHRDASHRHDITGTTPRGHAPRGHCTTGTNWDNMDHTYGTARTA